MLCDQTVNSKDVEEDVLAPARQLIRTVIRVVSFITKGFVEP